MTGGEDLNGEAAAIDDLDQLAAVLRRLRRREARGRRGTESTLRQLAAATGWSHSILGDYFGGRTLPPTDRFDVLIQLLGADAAEQRTLATARDRVEEGQRTLSESKSRGGDSDRPVRPPVGSATDATALPMPMPAPVPRELPADVASFVGRVDWLAAMDGLLAGAERGAPMVISALAGTAGVGKTALAVHWAHTAAHRFPDGCLYLDLHGYGPGRPVQPGDALIRLLRTLSGGTAELGGDLEELAARFRTLVADRRVLIVLDNARSAEQIRPLLPGSAAARVLVTSRAGLSGLVARDGAHRIVLDALSERDAVALLRALIGRRVDDEPEAARLLAERCARLPLALRLAGEFVNSAPAATLTELAARLESGPERLDLLSADGDPHATVRTVFSWSYLDLPDDAARLFRLIGAQPGPDIGLAAAARLADVRPAVARQLLDRLSAAHLVSSTARDRFRMHDLLRGYAAELAQSCDPDTTQTALTRLFEHQMDRCRAMVDQLYPQERQARRPSVEKSEPGFANQTEARDWFDSERAAVIAAVAYAAGHGRLELAVELAAVTVRHLETLGLLEDALTVAGHAFDAAHTLGDEPATAWALANLGRVHWQLGSYGEALKEFQQALELQHALGDADGEARTLNNIAGVHWRWGDYEHALRCLQQALERQRGCADRSVEAKALTNIGTVQMRLGEYEQALDSHRQALDLFRAIPDRLGEGLALNNLGIVHRERGHLREALDCLGQALAAFDGLGDRVHECTVRGDLGVLLDRLGRPTEALAELELALTGARECGDRGLEADILNSLGTVLRGMDRMADSRQRYAEALSVADSTGARLETARALDGLGHALRAAGERNVAREHWGAALEIYEELDQSAAETVRALIKDIEKD